VIIKHKEMIAHLSLHLNNKNSLIILPLSIDKCFILQSMACVQYRAVIISVLYQWTGLHFNCERKNYNKI
jgi:hypothetical protein